MADAGKGRGFRGRTDDQEPAMNDSEETVSWEGGE